MPSDKRHAPTRSARYVPCLRWKLGEYQALFRLSSEARDSIVPLIEVAEIGFDFETRAASATVDNHLHKFAERVASKWGARDCYLDLKLIDAAERMSDGTHPAEYVFEDLRSRGALAIPTLGLRQDSALLSALVQVIKTDDRGACIRLNLEDAGGSELKQRVSQLLSIAGVSAMACDLILDLGTPNFLPIDGLVRLLHALISELPHLNTWRTFSIIGTSFPATMAELPSGVSTIPRNEWLLFKTLRERLARTGARVPRFGDYGVAHPAVPHVDMRLVKPYASLRYTTDEGWLVARGQNVRDHGYGQYRDLCRAVLDSGFCEGPDFSRGDEYICDCAEGSASTGNLSTWRWVGTNHHIEKVLGNLASLDDS